MSTGIFLSLGTGCKGRVDPVWIWLTKASMWVQSFLRGRLSILLSAESFSFRILSSVTILDSNALITSSLSASVLLDIFLIVSRFVIGV